MYNQGQAVYDLGDIAGLSPSIPSTKPVIRLCFKRECIEVIGDRDDLS